MVIDKDFLLKRIESYEAQRKQLIDQAQGNINSISGAILEAKALLEELSKPDAPEEAPEDIKANKASKKHD